MDTTFDRLPIPARTAQAHRIKRRQGPASDTDFEGLREAGIHHVQVLSGQIWTDYNLHDPGVTILEQLCYALTDLVYRADFPVKDHLTGEDGRIAYQALALHAPAEVFPCRAATIADYRGLLLNSVRSIDNAWLSWVAEDGRTLGAPRYRGLYRIVVKQSGYGAAVFGDDMTKTLQQVGATYCGSRTVCEDVGEIVPVAHTDYRLQGAIEIGGTRIASDIVADIYDVCAKMIAAGAEFRSFEWALAQGHTLENVLNACLTTRGVLVDEDAVSAERSELFMGDVAAKVLEIPGVRAVTHLALGRDGEAPVSGTLTWDRQREAPRLALPPDSQRPMDHIVLTRGGSMVDVSSAEVRARCLDLRANSHARQLAPQTIDALCPLPTGVHRDFQRYSSIQSHFPAVYGINAFGLPSSASLERKAQALQLKAYLVLFEQIIANSAAHLHHLRELFSTRDHQCSYWSQVLGDGVVPGISELYPGGVVPAQLPEPAMTYFDHDQDRWHRVLDYLLALHGETFTQGSLRQWHRGLDPAELEEILLANKLAYLRNILPVCRDRAGAFDYTKPSWNAPENCGGFQRRVSLLLGFRFPHSRALALGVPLDPSHGEVRDAQDGEEDCTFKSDEKHDKHFHRVTQQCVHRPVADTELREVAAGKSKRLREDLFRYGVDLGNYRIARLRPDEYLLVFRPQQAPRWWVLAKRSSVESANEAANRLQRYLIDLGEGLHVVEHILLRPRPQGSSGAPASFYSLRMTVVFPSWPARCGEPGFRQFAEETVQINCPAHAHAECLWLDYRDMRNFEALYGRWLKRKLAVCGRKAVAMVANDSAKVGVGVAGACGVLTLYEDGGYRYSISHELPPVQALRGTAQTLRDSFQYTVADAAGERRVERLTFTIRATDERPLVWVDKGATTGASPAADAAGNPVAAGNVFADADNESNLSALDAAARAVTLFLLGKGVTRDMDGSADV